jgi:hypothetical protein
MSLLNFLNFNKCCPICDRPLQLYMQWIDSHLFKSEEVTEGNLYKFVPFKRDIGEFAPTDFIELERIKRSFIMSYKSSIEYYVKDISSTNMYFFFLCNENSFNDVGFNDYEIQLYKACYFRSTPIIKLKKHKEVWKLNFSPYTNLTNKNEAFSIIQKIEENNKVYMVNIDYHHSNTTLWHYSFTKSDESKEDFVPKTFEKKIEHLPKRPFNFKDQNKLIKKFDSWILVS